MRIGGQPALSWEQAIPSLERLSPCRASQGGANFGNVVAAHERCNGAKGDRMPTGCEAIWLDVANAGLGILQ